MKEPMNTTKTELLESLVEQLADIEHQRWSDWQKYCHKVYKDGKFEEFMPRWERQIKTPYSELSETEKQSDRDQVERYLPLLSKALDRYRDIVVEEEYKNGFKDGMNNRERTSKKIFNIVSKYQTHHGYPPTLKEIKDACGAKSITTVQRALVNLKKMGLISQNKYQKRAWYIPTIPMVLREQTNNNTTKE